MFYEILFHEGIHHRLQLNYLAHILLSHPHEDHMLGNFYGDFTRSAELYRFRDGIVQGVKLHREIDRFTDDHDAFRESLELLRPNLGKYSSVALDVLNDFLLVQNWNDYTTDSLREFCDDFYRLLEKRGAPYPAKLQRQLQLMIDHDFLMSASTRGGLMRSFQHLDRRARFDSDFTKAPSLLFEHLDLFEKAFKILMNDLIAHYEVVAIDFSR